VLCYGWLRYDVCSVLCDELVVVHATSVKVSIGCESVEAIILFCNSEENPGDRGLGTRM
jgi:hypothetical protein